MIGKTRCCTIDERSSWAIGLWAGLALLDVALWSRSFIGAMMQPLSAPLAIGSSLVLMTTAVMALILWRRTNRATEDWQEWWPELATLLLPVTWGLAVGWGTSPFALGGLLACWGLLIGAVGLVHGWGVNEGCETVSVMAGGGERLARDEEKSAQWQKRLVVDGKEFVEGEVQVDFAVGQKESTVHLAFCPPLAGAPEIHAEDSEGSDLDIRTEASHPYGARLSVRRRSGTDQPESRLISYSAMPAEVAGSAA